MKTNIIKALFGLILTFSISGLYAQSPRIKLNQIVKDTVSGSVLISNLADSNMVYSRNFYIGSDTSLVFFGTTIVAGGGGGSFVTLPQLTDSLALYATKVQLSDSIATVLKQVATDLTLTGDGTDASPLKVDTSVIATVSALRDSLAGIISSVSTDVTLTGDGSVGNPLKVDTTTYIATKGDLNGKQDQLNGTGFVKALGTTITYDNSTYLTTEVDGSVTNEIQDISTSGAAGNISISSGSTLNLNVNDADASATNEGSLTVGAGTASTSVISSNTSGSTDVTLTAGSNITLSETGNNITIAATGGGASYNNISETADTVYVAKFLNVDTSTLYVDAVNNRVGIGTSSPSSKLSVVGTTDLQFGYDFNTSASTIVMGADLVYPNGQTTRTDGVNKIAAFTIPHYDLDEPNVGVFQAVSDSANNRNYITFGDFSSTVNGPTEIRFNTSSSYNVESDVNTSMFIDNNGKVGIGTGLATPGSKLHVYSTTANDVLLVQDNDGTCEAQPTTSTLTWSCSSDARLKTNIRDAESVLDYINGIRIREYNVINTYENAIGVVAQEMLENYPELVTMGEDGYYRVSSLGSWTIVKAIQEQQAIIETQEQKISDLETTIQSLITRIENLENK